MTTLATALTDLQRRIGYAADQADLVDAINAALYDIGSPTQVDQSSVSISTTEVSYALPATIYNVVKIEYQNEKVDSDDWLIVRRWKEVDGDLYLAEPIEADTDRDVDYLRIYYNPQPTVVEDLTDTINNDIPMPLLIAVANYHYQWKIYSNRSNVTVKDEMMLQKAQADRTFAESKWRVHRLEREGSIDLDQTIDYPVKESSK